jgi:hypothetical protein
MQSYLKNNNLRWSQTKQHKTFHRTLIIKKITTKNKQTTTWLINPTFTKSIEN